MALDQERLNYEIVMAIGNSQVMDVMLKESLTTYLRKLNCLAGAVFRQEEKDGVSCFNVVHAIPKRMRPDSVFRKAIDRIPSELTRTGHESYVASLPEVGSVGEFHTYVMELPGFGALLLVKSAPGLSEPDIKSLSSINAKLARACVFCDVNERLNEEIVERKKAEEKYRAMVDNSLDGIYQSSMEGKYLHVNPALARIFGYSTPEQLMNEVSDVGMLHYVHASDRQRFVKSLLKDGQVHMFEFEYRRKDGTRGWMSTSARLNHDEAGNPSYIEGACRDISPTKRAELALMEAKLQAEHLSQIKSNLISMVSHELRTPLTSILGFAIIMRKRLRELLSGDELTDRVAAILSRVEDNSGVIVAEGQRLTEMINNVLDLAKLEAGQYEWDMETVSLSEILKHSVSTTEILFQECPVDLVGDFPDDLPPVLGDHGRLIQVTINLISNAAKFTEEGEVRIAAGVEGESVTVRVIDSGIGVPEGKSEEIFETFRQLGNTLTGKPQGSGLGLAISREIIEFHGGRIWHKPAPGGGSVFAFSIPILSLS